MTAVDARYLAQCVAAAPAISASASRRPSGPLNWREILSRSGVPEPAWQELRPSGRS